MISILVTVALVVATTPVAPQTYTFSGVFPKDAVTAGGHTPQQHLNPVGYVWCNGTLAAEVGPWDKTAKDGTFWDVVAEGSYTLPSGPCTIATYYWTFDGKTPVANFIASADFTVP